MPLFTVVYRGVQRTTNEMPGDRGIRCFIETAYPVVWLMVQGFLVTAPLQAKSESRIPTWPGAEQSVIQFIIGSDIRILNGMSVSRGL